MTTDSALDHDKRKRACPDRARQRMYAISMKLLAIIIAIMAAPELFATLLSRVGAIGHEKWAFIVMGCRASGIEISHRHYRSLPTA